LQFLENDQLDGKNTWNKVVVVLFTIWLLKDTDLGITVSLTFGYECPGYYAYSINKLSLKSQTMIFHVKKYMPVYR